MSIMVNSSKTPTGKTPKGQVAIRIDSKLIKACFPRPYFPGEPNQVKRTTGISNIDGWEAKARLLQQRLQLEMEEGNLSLPGGKFNESKYREILVSQKLIPDLKIVESATTSDDQLPPKPELSILEVWDMYCEFKEHELSISTFELEYKRTFTNFLKSAINAVGEDSLAIRDWLIKNRNLQTTKKLLNALSEAFYLAIKQDKYSGKNPFDGLSDGIGDKNRKKEFKQNEDDEDEDLLNQDKAFTWLEAETIMEFLKNSSIKRFKHFYHFISFKFLTGCRNGEAMGLWWRDIKWEKEEITIVRSYSAHIGRFKPTKNETIRRFPMPKNGRLWNLLKELPQGEPSDVVFKSTTGNCIGHTSVNEMWNFSRTKKKDKIYEYPGVLRILIDEGKVQKYLPSYNTRHTFITHQIFDLGRDPNIVNAWCEHSEKVSESHYRDTKRIAMQINPELPANQQAQQQSEIEILRQQIEEMKKLLQDRDK